MSDLPDEWLDAMLWRDWLDAWRRIGDAVECWERNYAPFINRRRVP